MEILSIKETNTTIIKNLIRIGDLAYFEEPLLTLFEDGSNGHLYLFDWVDRDKISNRWIVYSVLPQHIIDFVNNKISHWDLFTKVLTGKFYIDIEINHKLTDYNLLELNEVPLKYYPNKDDFFEMDDCPQFSKIQTIIFQALSRKKQENKYTISEIFRATLTITTVNKTRLNTINNIHLNTYLKNEIYIINLPKNEIVEIRNHYNQTNVLFSKANLNSPQLKHNKVNA